MYTHSGYFTSNSLRKIMFLVGVFIYPLILFAGQASEVEMADELRASGKIYVVVAVIAVIFIGIAVLLSMMERRISKIEKKLNGDKTDN